MKKYDNIQPSFDTNRTQLAEMLPLNTPFTVILDASEMCNFKCSYCFRAENNKQAWGYAVENNIMNEEIFKVAVSQIQQFPEDVRQISLSHHGEPLMNRKLPWMVRYIKERGIKSRISIHTNGSLLTPEYVHELADSRIDRVIVSLQGMTSEKYQKVCGWNIDFDQFYSNLRYFYEIKKNTQICIKIMDIALDEGEEESFYDMFTPIADRVFVEKVIHIWRGKQYLDSDKNDNLAFNKYGMGFPPQKVCPLIFHTIVVLPNGDVYPCTQLLQKEKLGNIQDKELLTLWNCEKRKEMLRNQCRLSVPEICVDCGIRQNTIYSEKDLLDEFKDQILSRI